MEGPDEARRGRNNLPIVVLQQAAAAAARKRKRDEAFSKRVSSLDTYRLDATALKHVCDDVEPGEFPIVAEHCTHVIKELQLCKVDVNGRDEIAHRFFGRKCGITDLSVVSAATGENEEKCKQRFAQLSHAALFSSMCVRKALYDMVRLMPSPDGSRVHVIGTADHASFDETSFALRDVASDGTASTGKVTTLARSAFGSSSSGEIMCKILQTQSEYGVLLGKQDADLPKEAMETCTQFTIFLGHDINSIQKIRSCSINDMHKGLEQKTHYSAAEDSARLKTRASMSDKHKSNTPAEAKLVARRRGWRHLPKDCELHAQHKGHEVAGVHVAGMLSLNIRIAKSLEMAGDFSLFRRCHSEALCKRFRFVWGDLEPEGRLYFHLAVRVMTPPGGKRVMRQVYLKGLPNVDLRAGPDDPIYVLVDRDVDVSDEGEMDRLADELSCMVSDLLLYRKFRIHGLQRWGGAEEGVCDPGLCEVFCGSLTSAYRLFAEKKGCKVGIAMAVNGELPESPDVGLLAIVPAAAPTDHHIASNARASGSLASSLEAEDKSYQRGASTLIEKIVLFMATTSPSLRSQYVCWRNVVAVLQPDLRAQLSVSSQKWELQQQARAARAPPDADTLTRDYRILVQARGVLENKMLVKMRHLLGDYRLWYLIPEVDMTNEVRSLAFCMITGSSGATFWYRARPNRLWPTRGFLALESVEQARVLDDDKPCLRDPFFAALYMDLESLTCVMARLYLLLLAMLLLSSKERVETGNANLRREVKSRVQVNRICIEDLASKWIGQQCRPPVIDSRIKEDVGAGDDEHAAKVAKADGNSGGPWRAHMRRSALFGGREASVTYHALTEEQKAELQRDGAEANENARAGNIDETSFGPKKRTVLQRNKMRVLQSRLGSLLNVEASKALEQAMDSAKLANAQPDDIASEVRRLQLAISRAEKLTRHADLDAIDKYAAEHSEEARQSLPADAGPLGRSAFVALPSQFGCKVLALSQEHMNNVTMALDTWLREVSGHKQNLRSSMQRRFAHLHKEIRGNECSEGNSQELEPTECFQLGFCICDYNGRLLYKVRNNLLRAFKSEFPLAVSGKRTLLQTQKIIVRCDAYPPGITEVDDELAEFWGIKPSWWHIAFNLFNPYVLVFQEFDDLRGHEYEVEANHDETSEVPLHASGFYSDIWDMLQTIDIGSTIDISFYELQTHSRPIPCVRPSIILVKNLQASNRHRIWPKQCTARRTRGRGRGRGGRLGRGTSSGDEPGTRGGGRRARGVQGRRGRGATASGSGAPLALEDAPVNEADILSDISADEGAAEDLSAATPDEGAEPDEEGDAKGYDECAEILSECTDEEDIFEFGVPDDDGVEPEELDHVPPVPPPVPAPPCVPVQVGGASSSSSHAPNVPDVGIATGPAETLSQSDRQPAEAAVFLPNGGKITHYSYGLFYAQCNIHGARCRRSFTSRPPNSRNKERKPTQGRALGFLAAWLIYGCEACKGKKQSDHLTWVPTPDQRKEARKILKKIGSDQVRLLVRCEQGGEASDSSEPDIDPRGIEF